MVPVFVGEQNPYGSSPDFSLYPEPRGCAGWRLCHLVLGLTPDEYLDRFARVNLLESGSRWSVSKARESARRIETQHRGPIVLLGARVSAAFGDPCGPWSAMWVGGRVRYVRLPHPSGLCREWNNEGAFERARQLLRTLGILNKENS